ncbi:MAG TPA: hypothetical protein VGY53_01065 [Isosphaeraceae bacterium]|nr:hypothetical protein [Isosphaeraceae bacterium]
MLTDPSLASLVLSLVVIAIAAILAVWQAHERRERDPELSEDDALHYARQDVRRFAGAAVMTLLGIGVLVGTRINARIGGRPQRLLFAGVWLAVFLLIMILLVLAWRDWLATFAYARRHRRALAEERRNVFAALPPLPPDPVQGLPGTNGPPGEDDG